jgi:hypothetical protein
MMLLILEVSRMAPGFVDWRREKPRGEVEQGCCDVDND